MRREPWVLTKTGATLAAALLLVALAPAGIMNADVAFAFKTSLKFALSRDATLALEISAEFIPGEAFAVVVVAMANAFGVDRTSACKVSADENGCYGSLVAVSLGCGREGQSAS